jgi:asparagine synthase (glutamine-hydrolysing)
LVDRTELAHRYRKQQVAQSRAAGTERESHYMAIMQGLRPLALEVLDKTAAAFSIEPRYPFWDRRLVEYCYSLPPEQKLRQGWNRFVLRRAMNQVVPAEVQWRADKADLAPSVTHGLLTLDRERLDQLILNDSEIIEAFVDLAQLRDTYHRLASDRQPQDMLVIWQAVTLTLWLKQCLIPM